jgi:hypothetical protein
MASDESSEKTVYELACEVRHVQKHSKEKQKIIDDTQRFYEMKAMRPRYGRRINRQTF